MSIVSVQYSNEFLEKIHICIMRLQRGRFHIMKIQGPYATLVLGIVVSLLLVLLLTVVNDSQREKLTSIEDVKGKAITKAWFLSDNESKEGRFYPLKQPFYLERYRVEDTKTLQQALSKDLVRIERPIVSGLFEDLYVVFEDGQEIALKITSSDEGFLLRDQKTITYYELQDADAINFFMKLSNESKSSHFLRHLIFTIIYWSTLVGVIIFVQKRRANVRGQEAIKELDKEQKKKESGTMIFTSVFVIGIIIIPNIYGAQHSLLVISMFLLGTGLQDYVTKQNNFHLNLLGLTIFLVYIYVSQLVGRW